MKCSNCGAILTCGCQSRTATNGAKACVHCILSLEGKLAQEKTVLPHSPQLHPIR